MTRNHAQLHVLAGAGMTNTFFMHPGSVVIEVGRRQGFIAALIFLCVYI